MYEKQLEKAAKLLNFPPKEVDAIVTKVKISCPGSHKPWLLKYWSEGQMILPEDAGRLRDTLHRYHILRRQKVEPFAGTHLAQYTFHKLEDAVMRLSEEDMQAASGLGVYLSLPTAKVIRTVGDYTTIEYSDPESVSKVANGSLGVETRWCTKDVSIAENYLKSNTLHVVFHTANGKTLPVTQYENKPGGQLMDAKDHYVDTNHELFKDADYIAASQGDWNEFWTHYTNECAESDIKVTMKFEEFMHLAKNTYGVESHVDFTRGLLAGEEASLELATELTLYECTKETV